MTGEVAVGDDVLLVGSSQGGLLEAVSSEERLSVRQRPRPVVVLPPDPGDVLGRGPERAELEKALEDRVPLEFHGEPGVGKTTLLSHLAHDAPASPPGGIVYLSARAQPLEDLLQQIHDLFVDSVPPRKASHQEIRTALADVQAMVLLDDVQLEGDELGALLDALPRSVAVLTSDRPRLGRQGRSVGLPGLSVDHGLTLLQRGLERPLTDEDLRSGVAIVEALKGNPLRLRQQLSLLAEPAISLHRVAADMRNDPPDHPPGAGPGEQPAAAAPNGAARRAVRPHSAGEFRLLTLLAAMPDTAIDHAHLATLTDLRDAHETLRRLERRGLIEEEGAAGRYRLAGDLADMLAGDAELEQWRLRALRHFAAFVGANRGLGELADAVEPARVLLRWAITAEHWAAALDLARGIEGCLALACRWGSWAEVLQAAHIAARALGDEASRAWALHQLGTRALCLGSEAGHATLVEALRIREQIGDGWGAEVTQHNLVCPLNSLTATRSFSRIRAKSAADDPTEPITRLPVVGLDDGVETGMDTGDWGSSSRSATVVKLTSVLILLCGLGLLASAMWSVLPHLVAGSEADDEPPTRSGTSAASARPWSTPSAGSTRLPSEPTSEDRFGESDPGTGDAEDVGDPTPEALPTGSTQDENSSPSNRPGPTEDVTPTASPSPSPTRSGGSPSPTPTTPTPTASPTSTPPSPSETATPTATPTSTDDPEPDPEESRP